MRCRDMHTYNFLLAPVQEVELVKIPCGCLCMIVQVKSPRYKQYIY
ncbi:hypothetical protein BACCELL_03518 [Bacteroides cellulosilyticus DSM 14838]|uniref:Uncharacterized protein n=1 Tax=Bacteroides cellulosilyticus DSM 14838 TaxID=537012 RepID=E2NGU3_9BACE|nr:hypothetical protein BACCELL_03518 [Bacteroides cellulosilyticus DSM 14838]